MKVGKYLLAQHGVFVPGPDPAWSRRPTSLDHVTIMQAL